MRRTEQPEAGFRDLFAELPQAVFAALRAIGEQAIEDAKRKNAPSVAYRPSPLETFNTQPISQYLCERYGWSHVMTGRNAVRRQTDIGGKFPCGHWTSYSIPDEVIEDAKTVALLDTFDEMVACGGRDCFCMQRTVFS